MGSNQIDSERCHSEEDQDHQSQQDAKKLSCAMSFFRRRMSDPKGVKKKIREVKERLHHSSAYLRYHCFLKLNPGRRRNHLRE